jgi:hypothetical protein
MPEIKGGCLCGAVHHTAQAPEVVVVCHCRDCQKFTGSAFGVLARLPQSAIEIQGALKTFTKTNPGDRRYLIGFRSRTAMRASPGIQRGGKIT